MTPAINYRIVFIDGTSINLVAVSHAKDATDHVFAMESGEPTRIPVSKVKEVQSQSVAPGML